MPFKKILLVGNANHQFITNYAKWLKKESDKFRIDILTDRPVKKSHEKLYDDIYHVEFNGYLSKIINKIKGIRRYYRFLIYIFFLRKISEYDYIHFHYLNVDSCFLVAKVKKYLNAKIIISIWGSDFYRIKERDLKYFKKACKSADKITFTNEQTRNTVKHNLNISEAKLYICRFGLAPLEVLKKMNKSRSQCKKDLEWNQQKISITIGYNSNPAQQHLKILEQFNTAALLKYKDKIQLIFPLTYGSDEAYKEKIERVLEKSQFEYKTHRSYLSDLKIAEIRQASDIMIQLQETDQFSGSMQEHLYTGDVVITGSWLPYQTMKDYGAYFLEVDEVEDLVDLVPKVLKAFEAYKKKTNRNPEVIQKLSSWEENIKDWIALYN